MCFDSVIEKSKQFFSRANRIWLYGLCMGLLLILLEVVSYRRIIIRDISLDVYSFVLGVIFIGLGIWVGVSVSRRKWTVPVFGREAVFNLTDRELEVLRCMASGMSNQEIADQLFVSTNTIKTHTSNIFSKMNVKRRTQAIEKARKASLI